MKKHNFLSLILIGTLNFTACKKDYYLSNSMMISENETSNKKHKISLITDDNDDEDYDDDVSGVIIENKSNHDITIGVNVLKFEHPIE